jgi:hypothetical protein
MQEERVTHHHRRSWLRRWAALWIGTRYHLRRSCPASAKPLGSDHFLTIIPSIVIEIPLIGDYPQDQVALSVTVTPKRLLSSRTFSRRHHFSDQSEIRNVRSRFLGTLPTCRVEGTATRSMRRHL